MPLTAFGSLHLWITLTSLAPRYTTKVVLGRWEYLHPGAGVESISVQLIQPCCFVLFFYNAHLKRVFSYSFLYWKMLPMNVNCVVVRGVHGGQWSSASPHRVWWLSWLSKQTPQSGLEPNLLSVCQPWWNSLVLSPDCEKKSFRKLQAAKIHSLESLHLQILFNFEQYFFQVHLLGFHLREAYLGVDKSPWRFAVGLLGNTSQRWYPKGCLDVPHFTCPWSKDLYHKGHISSRTSWSQCKCWDFGSQGYKLQLG